MIRNVYKKARFRMSKESKKKIPVIVLNDLKQIPLYKRKSKESNKKISVIALIFKQIALKKESNLPIKRNKENINKN